MRTLERVISRLEAASEINFPRMPTYGLEGTYTDQFTSKDKAIAFVERLQKLGDTVQTGSMHKPGIGVVFVVCHNKYLDRK